MHLLFYISDQRRYSHFKIQNHRQGVKVHACIQPKEVKDFHQRTSAETRGPTVKKHGKET